MKYAQDCAAKDYKRTKEESIETQNICFTRKKEILEQLSKPRFFTGFKSRALFSLLRSREIKGDIFALRKKLFL